MRYAIAAANEAGSKAIGGSFNAATGPNSDAEIFTRLATEYVTNMLTAKGVSVNVELPRTLAQDAITLFQVGITNNPNRAHAFLNNCTGAYIEGNTAILTEDQAECHIPSAITSIWGPSFQLDVNGTLDIDKYVGQIVTQHTPYGNIPIMLLDGRGEFVTDLQGDNLVGDFTYNTGNTSTIDRIVELQLNGVLLQKWTNEPMDVNLEQGSYDVVSYRRTPQGNTINKNLQDVVFLNGPKPKIVGVDLDKDGDADLFDANNDGIMDGPPLSIDCNFPINYEHKLIVEPAGTYSFFTNELVFPENMSLNQGTGEIIYNPTCDDAGKTFGPEFRASNGFTGTNYMIIQYRVE